METKLPMNPWLSMWTQPRKTVRMIIEANPRFRFFILSAIYGFPMALNIAQNMSLGASIPLWAIIVGALIVCTVLGIIGISISTWLLHVTGRWIGGKGNYLSIRAAVAWSNVPNIATILMWFVLMGMFGAMLFSKQFSDAQFVGVQAGVVFIVFLVQVVASVWGFILLLQGLGEAQGFSVWKALINVIIPFVIVVAIIWIVGWLIFGTGTINQ